MFLIIAASVVPFFGCGTLMSAVQSILALCFGMTGSMGLLSPIGYILPGIIIDLILFVSGKFSHTSSFGILLSSVAASVTAALTASIIVFRLNGVVLLLYVFVAASSGGVFGLLAVELVKRLKPVIALKREEAGA